MNPITETTTNAAAGAAVVSPWWLPSLHDFSSASAELLPILGVVWLLVQIGVKLYVTIKRRKAPP